MRNPIFYRRFDYDRNLLPNKHLAKLEEGVENMEQARERTGLTVGYPGWMMIYYTLLSHLHPEEYNVIVETGTNQGCTTIILAQALKDSGYPGKVLTVELDEQNFQKAQHNIREAELEEYVELNLGNSHDFLSNLKKEYTDVRIAFLDASHLYDDVKGEFEAVVPLLGDQALVIMDNTYQIAEPHEDQRVFGFLHDLKCDYGGNLINLEFVSWYTPGIAIWQKQPLKEKPHSPYLKPEQGSMRLTTEQQLDASSKAIPQFKNQHQGERCVIIGNGPSLNQMDLSFLEHEYSFGLNKIYLIFDQWDFRPSYFASVNPLVLKQHADEILEHIDAPKFLSAAGTKYIKQRRDDLFYLKNAFPPIFSTDLSKGMCEGYTVTFVAMQIAYYMGFDEVVLIGVDHSFATKGQPNKKVVSEGEDPNHFHPDYFGEGVEWHLPDLENSERYYRMAKQAFERDGRRILDATVDGQLDIFPKVDYQEHFKSDAVAPRSEPLPVEEQLQRTAQFLHQGLALEAVNMLQYLIDQHLVTVTDVVSLIGEKVPQLGQPQRNLLIQFLRHTYGAQSDVEKLAKQLQASKIDTTVQQLNQLIQAGELDKAEKFTNQLLNDITNHAGLWLTYAVLQVKRNRLEQAKWGLKKVLGLEPEHNQAQQLLDQINQL
ncbi:MAG: CmcI family methyltransferase [Bacteroidota bacterium]